MKILVHDYSGHPFQVQLSRELARRGYTVIHVYSSDFQTPKGQLVRKKTDPANFKVIGLTLGEPFKKEKFFERRSQEIRYGRILARTIREERPNVFLSSNTPLDAQRLALKEVRKMPGVAFIYWLQDIYSEAIFSVLSARFSIFGALIGRFYQLLEFRMLSASDYIICISDDFETILRSAGISPSKMITIENWAPLDDLPMLRKIDCAIPLVRGANANSSLVYTGTLGYKHNPDLLLQLAEKTNALVSVYSEGTAATNLAKKAAARGVSNLRVYPWVPFEELPAVLASADILVALIEPDAGVYSVPSKVLTYMTAGRPILASIPEKNLAARILNRENAGAVVSPSDPVALVSKAKELLGNMALRKTLGANARDYAENNFSITVIADKVVKIISTVICER